MRGIVAAFVAFAGCSGGDGLDRDRLPESTSTAQVPDPEALIVVDADGVRLDGQALISLDEALRGPAVITALDAGLAARAAAIEAVVARDASAPAFRGAFGLEVDRDLPADLLLRVLVTASRARFDKPWLVVVDDGGARHGIAVGLPSVAAAGVAAAAAEGDVAIGGYANPTVEVRPDQGFVVHVRDAVFDPGGGLAVRCDASPCAAWPTVELNRLARRIKLDHPKDRAVIVAPAAGATVQMVVTTLDAMRDDTFAGRGVQELFPEGLIGEAPR